MAGTSNPWTVLQSERLFEDDFVSFVRHAVRDAAGTESTYSVTRYKQIGVRILPVDREGHTWLVGQYRFAAGAYSWELPAGGGDLGEVPERAANRELREEVGLEADRWLEINRLAPAGSVLDLLELSFLAWDLSVRPREPDPQEVLEIRRLPFAQAVDMALAGTIANAGTVATLLMAEAKARRGDLPDEVARLLR
ncbi:MAG TPA: NUDIX hydrolase [Microvirga sp.]|jgi:8-oxo-dGTP pyrophosphatase MutT (NUDIX family)|nr:NUDIX hydrolase [Microvirga sp.]